MNLNLLSVLHSVYLFLRLFPILVLGGVGVTLCLDQFLNIAFMFPSTLLVIVKNEPGKFGSRRYCDL